MEELKRCPFCGGEAKLMKMGYPHWVYCEDCGARVHGRVVGEVDDEVEGICVDMEGTNFFLWYTTKIRKTGRHFSEANELLKKMK